MMRFMAVLLNLPTDGPRIGFRAPADWQDLLFRRDTKPSIGLSHNAQSMTAALTTIVQAPIKDYIRSIHPLQPVSTAAP
jgi:hypothetical protein